MVVTACKVQCAGQAVVESETNILNLRLFESRYLSCTNHSPPVKLLVCKSHHGNSSLTLLSIVQPLALLKADCSLDIQTDLQLIAEDRLHVIDDDIHVREKTLPL